MAPKTAPTLQSLEAKIDILLTKVEEISVLQAKVNSLEMTVHNLMERVTCLDKEVSTLKEVVNNREQQSRNNSIRLYGLCSSEQDTKDGGKMLAKRVYDSFVKPVLAAAKAGKHIEAVPSQTNSILEVYRVQSNQVRIPGQAPPPPSPIVVKFTSHSLRLAFLRNKKASLPPPSEDDKAAGTKKYAAVEDLTGPTYKKFKEMVESSLIEKVWSVEGRLRYMVHGDKSVYKVKSVFDSLAEITNTTYSFKLCLLWFFPSTGNLNLMNV